MLGGVPNYIEELHRQVLFGEMLNVGGLFGFLREELAAAVVVVVEWLGLGVRKGFGG